MPSASEERSRENHVVLSNELSIYRMNGESFRPGHGARYRQRLRAGGRSTAAGQYFRDTMRFYRMILCSGRNVVLSHHAIDPRRP